MHPTKKQLDQFYSSAEKAAEGWAKFADKAEQNFIRYACKIIKEYYTLEIITQTKNSFWVMSSKFPKDKDLDVVWFLQLTLSNWKTISALQDLETNKLYFSKSDIHLILNNIFNN